MPCESADFHNKGNPHKHARTICHEKTELQSPNLDGNLSHLRDLGISTAVSGSLLLQMLRVAAEFIPHGCTGAWGLQVRQAVPYNNGVVAWAVWAELLEP